jgi:hypothetical protein
MNTEQNLIPNAAVASPGLTPVNVVEALGRTSAKGDSTMLKVRIANVLTSFLLLASIAVLGGCNNKKEATGPPPQPQPVAQPAPQPTPQPAPQPAPTPSANAQPTTQGELPGLALTIQELKRSSSNLTLQFVVQSKNGFAFHYEFGEGGNEFGNIGGIHLIDEANKKKYFVLRDTNGTCVCSRDIVNIAAGSQSLLWAKFPAPPDEVQKITVEIPHFPPIEDVPITR